MRLARCLLCSVFVRADKTSVHVDPHIKELATMLNAIRSFIRDESGEDLIEYGLLAAFVAAVALVTIGSVVALSFLRALSQHSIYPCGDPRLQESINVVN